MHDYTATLSILANFLSFSLSFSYFITGGLVTVKYWGKGAIPLTPHTTDTHAISATSGIPVRIVARLSLKPYIHGKILVLMMPTVYAYNAALRPIHRLV